MLESHLSPLLLKKKKNRTASFVLKDIISWPTLSLLLSLALSLSKKKSWSTLTSNRILASTPCSISSLQSIEIAPKTSGGLSDALPLDVFPPGSREHFTQKNPSPPSTIFSSTLLTVSNICGRCETVLTSVSGWVTAAVPFQLRTCFFHRSAVLLPLLTPQHNPSPVTDGPWLRSF